MTANSQEHKQSKRQAVMPLLPPAFPPPLPCPGLALAFHSALSTLHSPSSIASAFPLPSSPSATVLPPVGLTPVVEGLARSLLPVAGCLFPIAGSLPFPKCHLTGTCKSGKICARVLARHSPETLLKAGRCPAWRPCPVGHHRLASDSARHVIPPEGGQA